MYRGKGHVDGQVFADRDVADIRSRGAPPDPRTPLPLLPQIPPFSPHSPPRKPRSLQQDTPPPRLSGLATTGPCLLIDHNKDPAVAARKRGQTDFVELRTYEGLQRMARPSFPVPHPRPSFACPWRGGVCGESGRAVSPAVGVVSSLLSAESLRVDRRGEGFERSWARSPPWAQVAEGYAFMSAEIRERGALEEIRGKSEEVAARRRQRALEVAAAAGFGGGGDGAGSVGAAGEQQELRRQREGGQPAAGGGG